MFTGKWSVIINSDLEVSVAGKLVLQVIAVQQAISELQVYTVLLVSSVLQVSSCFAGKVRV